MDSAAEDASRSRQLAAGAGSFTAAAGASPSASRARGTTCTAAHVVDVPRHGPSTSVDPDFRLDTAALFGRRAPLVVEIGSGRGEALVAAAAEHPEHDFLGLEVYVPGVAQTLVTMRHQGVTNVRLAVVNATEALATMLAPASVRELWTWFPDPWHKKRHHKRRLVTVPFTQLVARVLEPGGTWRFATDWDDYAEVAAERDRRVTARRRRSGSPPRRPGPHPVRAQGRRRRSHDPRPRRQTYTEPVTETTHAETLGITEGSVVWVVADSVEETALLDPLPDGGRDRRRTDRPHGRCSAPHRQPRLAGGPARRGAARRWARLRWPGSRTRRATRARSTAMPSSPWSASTAGPSAPRCGSTRRGPRCACVSSEPHAVSEAGDPEARRHLLVAVRGRTRDARRGRWPVPLSRPVETTHWTTGRLDRARTGATWCRCH